MKRKLKDIGFAVMSPLFRLLARLLLKRHQPKIIAITGSVGKTGTKRAVATVVEGDYRTQWHDGNYNSELGLPLALFELTVPSNLLNPVAWLQRTAVTIWRLLFWPYPYELLVLELGIDKVGDMDKFSRYISADICIITAVQPAHVAGIGDIETIYREKTKIMTFSELTVINGDDQRLMERLSEMKTVSSYGFNPDSTVHPDKINLNSDGTTTLELNGHTINSQLAGRHSVLPFMAAWRIGDMLDVDPRQRVRKLEELQPFSGRMNILPGKRGSLIVDDSYNAVTPQAVKAALNTLVELPAERRIAVLGNMNELGDRSEALHKELGAFIAKQNLNLLVTIGDNAKNHLASAAKNNGMSQDDIHSFMSPFEAGHFLAPLLKKGDVVLVKGSQNGVFAEETTALLLKNDADRNLLVRQNSFYQRIKHEQFQK